MIKDSDGDVFDEMRTVEQGLTFQEAEEAFARYHVDFTEDKYIALGLRNIHDDQYTNLAFISITLVPTWINLVLNYIIPVFSLFSIVLGEFSPYRSEYSLFSLDDSEFSLSSPQTKRRAKTIF